MLLIVATATSARADTHYVTANSKSPKSPYTNPGAAAKTIAEALAVAEEGDTVEVSAGTYAIDATIVVKKGITLQGVAADKTVIDAGGRCRCLVVRGTVKGLTITGGKAREGAGVQGGAGTIVTDCIIRDNTAERFGGGICVRIRRAKDAPCLIADCKILNNKVTDFVHTDYPFGGGGLYVDNRTTVRGCLIQGNSAAQRGGGVYCHHGSSVIENCTITENRAFGKRRRNPNGHGSMEEGGGGAYCDFGGQLRGCVFYKNHADKIGGGAVLSTGARAKNCTFVANTAGISGGGVQTLGVASMFNTIAYGNLRVSTAKNGPAKNKPDDVYVSHYYHVDVHQLMLGKVHFRHCCIGETKQHMTKYRFYLGRTAGYDVSRYKNTVTEVEPVRKKPGFVDAAGQNYRLVSGSPCLNAGLNEDWMAAAKDLAGSARLRGKAVDVGAYERAK
ncbi:MAG: hypothetical protein IIA67_05055 [Planctomycetes bacterium]|nr:hypothetical protein [Planctomycetota bacterium]